MKNSMSKLMLGYIPPDYSRYGWYDPRIEIHIDGVNLFDYEALDGRIFQGVMLEDFFSNNNNDDCLNGEYNIGWSGSKYDASGEYSYNYESSLGVLSANVKTKKNITTWRIIAKSRDYHGVNEPKIEIVKYFLTDEYIREIAKLKEYFLSYSWECNFYKIRRLCTEFIKKYKTKDNMAGDYVHINERDTPYYLHGKEFSDFNKIMAVNFFGGFEQKESGGYSRISKTFYVDWDGKTLENALENLDKFAKKELLLAV